MRYLSTMILAAALIAPPALSFGAPRTIDDCEKIDAADAYNQCLAAFGPVAHTRGAAAAQVQDAGYSDDGGAAAGETDSASSRHAAHGHSRRHASRHGWTRHAHGHHGRHTRAAADHPHGHGKRLAFTTVSSHTKLR